MRILVLNGPNLNLLGMRDKDHYGTLTLEEIEKVVREKYPEEQFEFFQSNHEGGLIDRIQQASGDFDALIINPGGYAHTSVAIKDALTECKIPKIEVHLSNLSGRDDFRQVLITATSCNGYVSGFKEKGYLAAVYLIKEILSNK
ncbi:MAG: 3-dehydroquinate dehydratase [Ignavibacteria bacterium]|jgi:3-dehydroquinate dehydratase-2|nr:3-dehydroquinate dehydratase [Ignavibacteria bacterium]MCU7514528.1 3-dehydroquinate dehydratase [Ignavibacteria bacterium]MCU7522391.1 3-dehydroquinate dehydratase [Ignavibacteria bacterium]MCU7525572.1 3-dehydroquinate dehydratase [Ignavibacteria bacterium]HEX2962056.1 type II 3-dehydroquinate dehydratase [Ignavibacteriales bacterium]